MEKKTQFWSKRWSRAVAPPKRTRKWAMTTENPWHPKSFGKRTPKAQWVDGYPFTPRGTVILGGIVIKPEGSQKSLFPAAADLRVSAQPQTSPLWHPLWAQGGQKGCEHHDIWTRPVKYCLLGKTEPSQSQIYGSCGYVPRMGHQLKSGMGGRGTQRALPLSAEVFATKSREKCCFQLCAHWWPVQAPVDSPG